MDEKNGTFMAARDPIGVVPLYWGWGRDGSVCFASEMKAIQEHCEQFEQFPPGHFIASGVRLYALATFSLALSSYSSSTYDGELIQNVRGCVQRSLTNLSAGSNRHGCRSPSRPAFLTARGLTLSSCAKAWKQPAGSE